MYDVLHANFAKGFRGGERQTELLVKAMTVIGLKQLLVVRGDSPLVGKLSGLKGLDIQMTKKPYFLRSRIDYSKVRLIHAHETKAAQWALLNNLFFGVDYVITRRVPKVPKDNIFTRSVYQRAKITVCLSKAIASNLKKTVPEANAAIIPSMCARLSFDQNNIEAIKSLHQGKKIIVTAGALVEKHKGQQYLIKAMDQINDKNIVLLLLGEGKDRASLEAQAKDFNNVFFLGFREDINDYLMAADVFAFPSLNEGLGSTLLDVMEAETPIVASNVDGIPDVVHHDKNGLLAEPGNVAEIAFMVSRLLEDQALSQRLVSEAKRQIVNYYPSVIAERYVKLYEDVLLD